MKIDYTAQPSVPASNSEPRAEELHPSGSGLILGYSTCYSIPLQTKTWTCPPCLHDFADTLENRDTEMSIRQVRMGQFVAD